MPENAEVKPGYKTSEFWITAAVTAAGLVTMALPENHWAARLAGAVISLGAQLGYTGWRSSVKKAG